MSTQSVKDYDSLASQLNSALKEIRKASQLPQAERKLLIEQAEETLIKVGAEMKLHTDRVVHIDRSPDAVKKMDALKYRLALVKGQGATVHGWLKDLIETIKGKYKQNFSTDPKDAPFFKFLEGDPFIDLPKFSDVEKNYKVLKEHTWITGKAHNLAIVRSYAHALKHQKNLEANFPKEKNQAQVLADALKQLGEANGIDFAKIEPAIHRYLDEKIPIDKALNQTSVFNQEGLIKHSFYTDPKYVRGQPIEYLTKTYLALQEMDKTDLSPEMRARVDIGLKIYLEAFTKKIDALFSAGKPSLVTKNNEPSRATEWAICLKAAAAAFFIFEKNDPNNALRLAQMLAEGQMDYPYLNDEAKTVFEEVRKQMTQNNVFDYKPFQVAYNSEWLREEVQGKESVIMKHQTELLERQKTTIPEVFQALGQINPGPYQRIDPEIRDRFEEVLLQRIKAASPEERPAIRNAFRKHDGRYPDDITKKILDAIGIEK